jgi:hypothetical protein
MLTYEEARGLAVKELDETVAILEEATIEKPYAWIFCYNSRKFLETGDIMEALGGNAPLFVSKTDGSIDRFRTGLSTEGMIEAYEEQHQLWSLVLTDDIYGDARKMLALKTTLNLSMAELAARPFMLAKGGEERLKHLQQALSQRQIATRLELS